MRQKPVQGKTKYKTKKRTCEETKIKKRTRR